MDRPMVFKYGVIPPRKEDSDSLREAMERASNSKKILDDYLGFLAEAEKTVLSPEINMQDVDEFIVELKVNLKLLKTRLSALKRRKRGGPGDVIAMYAVIAPRNNKPSK